MQQGDAPVTQWSELAREYEARRFPPTRRLDLHGEGPGTARERALRWIQTFAHEQPGADVLLVVERARRRGAHKGTLVMAVERLLTELTGRLVDRWSAFGEGSFAVRIAERPTMFAAEERAPEPAGPEGRTPATAGAAYLDPEDDIPEELLPLARRAAELRRTREALAVPLLPVVMRQLWIEAQALAMAERLTWEDALRSVLAHEEARMREEHDRA
ncbi:MAG: hypothetical protein JWM27_2822 [Gemmatimonadetes bacterium]|nr:hypothetical protein [Gemmatimonadota bacterium]